jgi:hypothetical protein
MPSVRLEPGNNHHNFVRARRQLIWNVIYSKLPTNVDINCISKLIQVDM